MQMCFNLNSVIASAESIDTDTNIIVDGDLSLNEGAVPYVANTDDLEKDKKKVEELTAKLKSKNNSIGIMSLSNVLSVPVFQQINGYYCGPATVKQVLHYFNGTSSPQATYASELGTTTSGTDMTKIPGVLNNHQSDCSYLYYSFSDFSEWNTRVYLSISWNHPVVIDIASTTSNWMYKTSGHFMCVSGYDNSGSTTYAWVTDPHPTYYGTYKKTANEVYTVNNAHWRHALIW